MRAEPRRLLVLAPVPPRLDASHGSARAIARLLVAHAEHSRVSVLALRRPDEPGVDDAVAGVCEVVHEVERIPAGRSLAAAWRERRRALALLRGAPLWAASIETRAFRERLLALCRDWQPDVVQAELEVMGLYLADVPRPARRVLVDHDPGIRRSGGARARAAWRRHLRAVASSTDALVVFSEEDRAAVRGALPEGQRVECIPLPWPEPPPPGTVAGGEGPPTVLFVGSFIHPPNVEAARRLVTVLPRLRARHPGLVLALVGESPPGDLGGDGVVVAGRVSDVGPWLAEATLVAVPLSSGGGVRLKVVEALSAGKAVVGTPLAFEGLEVEPGREALVADGDDALVEAIGGLLDDPGARSRLGTAARAWAERLPTAAVVGEAYDALYRSLAAP